MQKLTAQDKQQLGNLALQSIKEKTENPRVPRSCRHGGGRLNEKGASFVSIYIDGNLRGCIGHLKAAQPLYKDICQNAFSAAFKDPRFPPVQKKELGKLSLEISILSKPTIVHGTWREKFDQIKPKIHGIILEAFGRTATFLPQVWEQLPKKGAFLNNLCAKAGLPVNSWKSPEAKISTYTVQAI